LLTFQQTAPIGFDDPKVRYTPISRPGEKAWIVVRWSPSPNYAVFYFDFLDPETRAVVRSSDTPVSLIEKLNSCGLGFERFDPRLCTAAAWGADRTEQFRVVEGTALTIHHRTLGKFFIRAPLKNPEVVLKDVSAEECFGPELPYEDLSRLSLI